MLTENFNNHINHTVFQGCITCKFNIGSLNKSETMNDFTKVDKIYQTQLLSRYS